MVKLNSQQLDFFDFVKEMHGDQVRKYTGEPYWNHPLSVATIVNDYICVDGAIEIALGHDLLEDTDCTPLMIKQVLRVCGYNNLSIDTILAGIKALTDVYTSDVYIDANRKQRKRWEARRLGRISPVFQSVKYADIIDNTSSIMEHDEGFAEVYIPEKVDILVEMKRGNRELYYRCERDIEKAARKLGIKYFIH